MSTKKLSNTSNTSNTNKQNANKQNANKQNANKQNANTANTANIDLDRDIKTVSLYSVKTAILNAISDIAFARNNVSNNNDTVDSLLDLLLANKITKAEYKERIERLGKASTRTGDFRAINSLNGERVSSKGILSESLLKGGKNCQGNSPISLAVYRDAKHYDAICKLQDILTLCLNIGIDLDTKFDARDYEIALYKAIHVAQSKIAQYGIHDIDTEKAIVDLIKY